MTQTHRHTDTHTQSHPPARPPTHTHSALWGGGGFGVPIPDPRQTGIERRETIFTIPGTAGSQEPIDEIPEAIRALLTPGVHTDKIQILSYACMVVGCVGTCSCSHVLDSPIRTDTIPILSYARTGGCFRACLREMSTSCPTRHELLTYAQKHTRRRLTHPHACKSAR